MPHFPEAINEQASLTRSRANLAEILANGARRVGAGKIYSMEERMATHAISRRGFLVSGAVCASATAKPRPNFLFILADDHAGYVFGAAGNGQARTPNLDRLASEGTRFAQHYCNSPVCTPSRQSFFTGMLPHAAGVTRLPTPLAAGKPTLAREFQKAGYRTAVFGKMHFNRPAEPGLHGFDELLTEGELQAAWMKDVRPTSAPEGVRTKPPWRPFRDPARIWLNADTLPFPRETAQMKGSYLADRAVEYLKRGDDRPFALWVSFMEPHSPFDFPLEYRGRFAPREFTPPRVGPEDAWQIPLIFRDLSEDDKRGIIASYYTSVAFLDWNVGRVAAALRELKLDENTYVVYMADHGYNLGHHGRFEKHCGYDPAMYVPLVMRWPGRIRQGVVRDLTEHVDVTATIIDMMNLDPLPAMHGRSLRPYLETGPTRRRATTSSANTWKTRRRTYARRSGNTSSAPGIGSGPTATKPIIPRRGGTAGFTNLRPTPAR